MATTLLFSPLPSTTFLHKNPNSSSPNLLGNFSPTSLSISISINNNNANSHCRPSFCVSATAVGYPFATETKGSDASTSSSSSSHLDITKLGISQEIVSALARRGITQLFPIQRAVLVPAMEGRDMIGRAITGSGKTLAFGIPILDNIIRHRNSNSRQRPIPSALVLAPTRELARQVQKEFKESAPRLSSACLYGGVPIMSQMRALRSGIDIAVGTPGRIIDLVERGSLDLSEVKFVVLDEADQMLAVGFQDDVESILGYLPAKKQSMLFSATMPSWINQLSRKYLRNPLTIDLVGDSDQKLADGISLYSAVSTSSGKENMLPGLITRYSKGGKSIIFTRTKSDAEELSRSMHGTLASRALHGNMQQMQRDKTLAAFRDGRFSVLVATDVAARGLDIPNVDLVIHFELPNTSEIFVHRSGRTGRAGKKGTAVLLYTKAQRRAVNTIERDIGCKFEELPRIADGIGNKIGRMDMDESNYDRYDSPRSRVSNSTDHFSESRYGSYGGSRGQSSYGGSRGQSSYGGSRGQSNYGGSRGQSSYGGSRGQSYGANESRNRGSRGSNMGRFGSPRDSSLSRNPGSRDAHFSNPRTQSNTYDEFDRNRSTEKNTSERKQDGFQSILDMLKEQQ